VGYLPGKPEPTKTTAPEQIVLQSSFLMSATYDASTFSLTIEFKTGEPLVHRFVFPAVWQELKLHPSPGSYWNRSIKGKYPTLNLKRGLKVSDITKARKKYRPSAKR
jgi:hypothetical protein